MNKDEAREAAVRDSRDFRDRAVNQTLTLLFGNDTERRAFAKNTLASLFDMGASEQRRAASVDRRAVVEKAFEILQKLRISAGYNVDLTQDELDAVLAEMGGGIK